jgi:hypothetical protein
MMLKLDVGPCSEATSTIQEHVPWWLPWTVAALLQLVAAALAINRQEAAAVRRLSQSMCQKTARL